MKLLVANWKMNGNLQKLKLLTDQYINRFNNSQIETIICPAFIYLSDLSKDVAHSTLILGAQNCSSQKSGAHTGEISINMLKEFDVRYVIIGHSECREKGENEVLRDKLSIAIDEGLIPIFCVGEKIEHRKSGEYLKVIENQLSVLDQGMIEIVIAYEPVWAIGTQMIPTNQEITEVTNFIKSKYKHKVLYGGSVNANNINELIKIDDLNGFLVGGASLKADEFIYIEKVMREII